MNYRKKSNSPTLPPLKKIVCLLTLCGFTNATLATGFPITPLHLQDEVTTTTPAGVKPNIMLLIDDSGSMDTSLGNSTRMGVAKSALNTILNDYNTQVNWSLQTLWNNGAANYDGFTSDHTIIKNKIANMRSSGGTPTTARYFHVQDIVRDNIKNRCQKSYIVVMSDGDSNLSCNGNNFNLKKFDLGELVGRTSNMGSSSYNLIKSTKITAEHVQIFGTRNITESCSTVSGGNLMQSWDRDAGLQWFSSTLYTKDLKTGSQGEAFGGDWDDPNYPKQNIVTYTVGFGDGLSNEGRRYLVKGASPCTEGTCPEFSYKIGNTTYTQNSTDLRRHYYDASDASELSNAFESIFSNIKSENQNEGQKVFSATAPAISSNFIDGMAAAASLNTGSWSSELLFYDIDANGNLDMNSEMRPSFNNRQMLISDGDNVHLYSSSLNTPINTNSWFDIANAPRTNRVIPNQNEWRDGLLKWMARADTDENILAQKNTTNQFQLDYRIRPVADLANNINDQRSMGDIIDNSILAIGDFDKATRRQEFVVTSTNDGMVYVFKSQNNTVHPYDLKFNYAPAKMDRASNNGSDYVGKYYHKPTLNGYGNDSENNPHHYLLNGGMVVRSTDAHQNSKGKQIFMASTMGQAGRGAFAINIGGVERNSGDKIAASNIDAANWHQSVKLFETPKGADNQFGYTISTPQIGRVQIKPDSTAAKNDTSSGIHYATFVSNGYQYNTIGTNNQDIPTLYIYESLGQDVGLTPAEPQFNKGDLLKKITITNGLGGLSSPTLVDTNFDGVIDYAYAGDYGGNLYRFNLTSPNPDNWTATKIFQTANQQPITSAPAVYRNYANKYTVIVGTGSEIYQADLLSTDRQAIYGIFDNLDMPSPTPTTITDLLEQSLTTTSITKDGKVYDMRQSSNHAIGEQHKGWYIQLDAQNGERITTKPSVMGNSLLLSSRIYTREDNSNNNDTNKDPCLAAVSTTRSDASSWLMQFNLNNGGLIADKSKSVYIDYNLGSDAKFKSTDANSTQSYLFSGQKLDSLTSITLIDRQVEGLSRTTSGDSGGSGEDAILNPNAIPPKGNCVGEDSKAFTFNTAGESSTYDIFGVCQSQNLAFKRLSWREIF